jgi:flagellar biosynthesis chaperone FliJ
MGAEESGMSRRERIVDTVHRIAEVHERQAQVEVSRAQTRQRQAEEDVAGLEAENAAAEAAILNGGALGALERELLWAHRTWYRNERVITQERLAKTESEVAQAQELLSARVHETRKREKVRDHVVLEARSERFDRAQKELDEIATMRSRNRNPEPE